MDLPDTLRLVPAQLENFAAGSMRGYVLMNAAWTRRRRICCMAPGWKRVNSVKRMVDSLVKRSADAGADEFTFSLHGSRGKSNSEAGHSYGDWQPP